MSLNAPTEADVMELSAFLKSLVSKIDYELEDDNSSICQIPSPAAFEEVEKAQSLSLSASSFSTVWDIDDAEVSSYSEKLAEVKSIVELEHKYQSLELIQSGISSQEINADTCNEFSDISSDFIDNLQVDSSQILPFTKIKGSPFHLFNVDELDKATKYSHSFSNSKRHAAYYGKFPYSYDNGKTFHPARPFSENEYLQKIVSYIQIVIPGFHFNSAMVHKYIDGQSYIPHHADDEEEIIDGSSIVTISFGETRFIEFQNVASGSKISQKLFHGDVFIMEKSTQGHFTHSIPQDNKSELKPRISVTLRWISAPKSLPDNYSPVTNASETSPATTVTGFLNDLAESESPKGIVGDIIPILPLPSPDLEPTLEMPSQPKLLDQIHPSRLMTGSTPNQNLTSDLYQVKPPEEVLYISSSMFRNLDPVRLSSKDQKASKLFYPGADSARMLINIKKDSNFNSIQKDNISKIFLLTGSNNIDGIHRRDSSIEHSLSDILNLLRFLSSSCPNAKVNVLNILPRKFYERNQIINSLNSEIRKFCDQSEKFCFIDTYNNYMFSNHDGTRRNKFFMPPGHFGPDNVHLNGVGVVRLGKHLKFLSHQK